jgi:hypothetical protein
VKAPRPSGVIGLRDADRRCARQARPAACDAVMALNPPQAGHPTARCARSRSSRDRCGNGVISLELATAAGSSRFSRLRSVLVPP